MTRRVMGRIACAAAVLALGAAVAVGTTGADASTEAKPNWLLIRGFWPSGTGPEVVGSAAGRGWLGFGRGDSIKRSLVLGSFLAASEGGLHSPRPSRRCKGLMMIVGSQLDHPRTRTSPLEPGEWPNCGSARERQGGSAERRARRSGDPPASAVQPGRAGRHSGGRPGCMDARRRRQLRLRPSAGLLHARASSALSLAHRPQTNMSSLQLGLDSRGRLWLAWLDLYRRNLGGVRMVELDPETLSPAPPSCSVSWFGLVGVSAPARLRQSLPGDRRRPPRRHWHLGAEANARRPLCASGRARGPAAFSTCPSVPASS